MEHLLSKIDSFIENVPELKGEDFREEIYNYIMWSLLRHIDYSLIIDEHVRGSLSYYTMLHLYKELCGRNNIEVTLGYMCISKDNLRFIESKLNIGNLYIFYLTHLDMSEEFQNIALELVEYIEERDNTIGDINKENKVKNRLTTLLKRIFHLE